MSLYDYTVTDVSGNEVSMRDVCEGNVVLITNTASECGWTRHYEPLQELYQQHKDKGFVVIAFPCNQFGKQEPGTSEEIQDFCDSNYKVTFPLSEKIEVNGNGAHPLYKYLKKELKGKHNDSVKWNFTKFLINKNGEPSQRFSSTVEPEDIKPFIDNLI